jgi:hypothetical protein
MHSDIHNARRLAQKIKTGKITHGMTVREIYRKQWAGIDKTATIEALDVLEECHWLRVEEIQPDSGRPSPAIQLHPELRGKSDG